MKDSTDNFNIFIYNNALLWHMMCGEEGDACNKRVGEQTNKHGCTHARASLTRSNTEADEQYTYYQDEEIHNQIVNA